MALKIKTISIGLVVKRKPIKFSKTNTNIALKRKITKELKKIIFRIQILKRFKVSTFKKLQSTMALKIKTISIRLVVKRKPIKFSKTNTNIALKRKITKELKKIIFRTKIPKRFKL